MKDWQFSHRLTNLLLCQKQVIAHVSEVVGDFIGWKKTVTLFSEPLRMQSRRGLVSPLPLFDEFLDHIRAIQVQMTRRRHMAVTTPCARPRAERLLKNVGVKLCG